MTCRHYWISGRVQGVFFRAATREQAELGRIGGWVRNLADGRVEVFGCGGGQALAGFEQWLYRGPPAARVTGVEVVIETCAEEPTVFTVR